MRLLPARIGSLHVGLAFLMNGLPILACIAALYLAPSLAALTLGYLVMFGMWIMGGHISIGSPLRWRWSMQHRLRDADTELPASVPTWVARFASESDNLLYGIAKGLMVLSTVICGIIAVFASGRLLAAPIAELGWFQIFFVPHFAWLVVLGLVSVRDTLLHAVESRLQPAVATIR